MARDGDPEAVEAVAEIVESLTENGAEVIAVAAEEPETAPAVPVVEPAPEAPPAGHWRDGFRIPGPV